MKIVFLLFLSCSCGIFSEAIYKENYAQIIGDEEQMETKILFKTASSFDVKVKNWYC